MATRKTGISRDLIIHPGETIADILADRGMTEAEFAIRSGVSLAYISGVIAGEEDITAAFARTLENTFDVPQSFWLNLQAHYNAELREFAEEKTVIKTNPLINSIATQSRIQVNVR